MRELAGKTAFVTGGASGIGFALGRAFAEAGMKVMLADVEGEALAVAVESLHALAPNMRGVACDVTDPASVARAAEATCVAFGKVHVVCNNAGVAGGSGIDDISLENFADAIREDELYVFTHPEMHASVEERFATILAAMDKTR